MKVVFFHRKSAAGNFSIENLFEQVRKNLPVTIISVVHEMQFASVGLLRRIYCCWEAWHAQGDVNHVTGDIHFIAIFLKRKKTILTIHDVGFMKHPNRLARIVLRLFWLQLPVWRARIITTVSFATKLEVLKFVKVDPAKIRVIYNPISPLFLAQHKEFNVSKPIVLQVGTKQNKNLDRLAEALTGISCEVHIIGELDHRLIEKFEKCRIHYVAFKNLSTEQVVQQYMNCDILVFVSTIEGFGLPIIEANAVGRVVVTSNVSSMPEIAGDAAHFVDPFSVNSIREGVLKVINDVNYRKELIVKGYENRKRFDEVSIALQYAELYKYASL